MSSSTRGPADHWIVRENSSSPCPGLTLDELPAGISDNLRVQIRGGITHVLATNIAGIVQTRSGGTLEILPKVDSLDPVQMLLYLGDCSSAIDLDGQTRIYAACAEELRSVDLTREFAAELRRLSSKPRVFDRRPTGRFQNVVSGSVKWHSSARRLVLGLSDPIHTTVCLQTFDRLENIVIGAAARQCLNNPSLSTDDRSLMRQWSELNSRPRINRADLGRLYALCVTRGLGGSHAYYTRPVILALLILGVGGLTSGRELSDGSRIFNMPGIYEDFIRRALMRASVASGLTVRKGFQFDEFLINSGEFEMIPDITIYRGSNLHRLLDVKYKVPDAKDFYQIYAYMQIANADRAWIVSPMVDDGKRNEIFDGKVIEFVRIDAVTRDAVANLKSRILND